MFFDLRSEEQHFLPDLLRRLLRLPEFRTRAARMGKVVRIDDKIVTYWQDGKKHTLHLAE